ncbi:MAG: HAD family hydrolase [Acutalibacter sp.]|nr:HAD family hydrolase [Acutalibacter sp.]
MEKYVVWDWNGTLLDDVDVCIDIVDGMLVRRGLQPLLTRELYWQVFTFPIKDYYARVGFDFEKEPYERLAEEYMDVYDRMVKTCPLFPEAEEALDSMNALGVRQVIVSASRHDKLTDQVRHAGIYDKLEAVLGMGNLYAHGKEGLARQYFSQRGIAPEQVLFVGDTLHDAQVAKDMGCGCVLIARGHQGPEQLKAANVPILSDLLAVKEYLS